MPCERTGTSSPLLPVWHSSEEDSAKGFVRPVEALTILAKSKNTLKMGIIAAFRMTLGLEGVCVSIPSAAVSGKEMVLQNQGSKNSGKERECFTLANKTMNVALPVALLQVASGLPLRYFIKTDALAKCDINDRHSMDSRQFFPPILTLPCRF